MKIITGIICEYNPFHNGHIYHINEARRLTNCDILICVMSGNFVQRGEVALIDKSIRATTAIKHGVDIVIELPFVYSTQSANNFAKASVELLALAKVDYIVFGSECNDIVKLEQLSNYTNITNDKSKSTMNNYIDSIGELKPNDILGMNYIKYMKPYNIKPITIKRTNNYHDKDLHITNISSATSIRNNINNSINYTPINLNECIINTNDKYFNNIKILLSQDKNYLKTLFMMDEGIENLFKKNITKYNTYEEFINSCTNKKYTRSRINRTLIHLLNSTTKETINNLPVLDYLRVLAFNNTGRLYLSTLQDINIVGKLSQLPSPYNEIEVKSNYIYNLYNDNGISETIYPIYIKE